MRKAYIEQGINDITCLKERHALESLWLQSEGEMGPWSLCVDFSYEELYHSHHGCVMEGVVSRCKEVHVDAFALHNRSILIILHFGIAFCTGDRY